jgi:hypothetical protein
VPTSVLLAVLAAAGLLALAPALVRRYDATERIAVERATSTARVLTRRRRQRSVPGPVPIMPPRFLGTFRSERNPLPRARNAGSSGSARASGGGRSGDRAVGRTGQRRTPAAAALYRRRRVFLALVLLNVAELAGVFLVGPGFWTGFAVSFAVLLADLIYLRRQAVLARRRRTADRRRETWVAAEQAAVRREHDRRAAERKEAARRAAAEREAARRDAAQRAADHVERYTRRTTSATGTDSLLGLRESLRTSFEPRPRAPRDDS